MYDGIENVQLETVQNTQDTHNNQETLFSH